MGGRPHPACAERTVRRVAGLCAGGPGGAGPRVGAACGSAAGAARRGGVRRDRLEALDHACGRRLDGAGQGVPTARQHGRTARCTEVRLAAVAARNGGRRRAGRAAPCRGAAGVGRAGAPGAAARLGARLARGAAAGRRRCRWRCGRLGAVGAGAPAAGRLGRAVEWPHQLGRSPGTAAGSAAAQRRLGRAAGRRGRAAHRGGLASGRVAARCALVGRRPGLARRPGGLHPLDRRGAGGHVLHAGTDGPAGCRGDADGAGGAAAVPGGGLAGRG